MFTCCKMTIFRFLKAMLVWKKKKKGRILNIFQPVTDKFSKILSDK